MSKFALFSKLVGTKDSNDRGFGYFKSLENLCTRYSGLVDGGRQLFQCNILDHG